MFSTQSKTKIIILANSNLLSANAFNLVTSEILSFGKGLTHSHTMPPFDTPKKQAFENTVVKGEIAPNKQFLLFPQCFLPVWIAFCHFRQI